MWLSELSPLPGVSGDEGRVRDRIIEALRGHVDRMWVDSLGNLFALKGAQLPGPRLLVCAHMDEVGLIVTSIEDDGTLRFQNVGGIDARVLPGIFVRVGDDLAPGVIGTKPIHLKKASEREKVIDADALYIDIGAKSRSDAEKRVAPGAYASFWTEYEEWPSGLAKGKAFDDRVGCAILIELLLQAQPNAPLIAAFTVQEELGLRGAQVVAEAVQPQAALVLEGTTCADIPLSEPHGESTRLGDGPALTLADAHTIAHPGMVKALMRTAEAAQIPFQWKRTLFGGTDAGALQYSGPGIPTGIVSVPCRYIHTPAALLSLSDVAHTQRLVQSFVASFPNGVEGSILSEASR